MCQLPPRKIKLGKMSTSSRLSTLVRGCFLPETICAHSQRRKMQQISNTLQLHSTDYRLSGCFPSHLFSTCNTIFTVTCSLRFGIGSRSLSSERKFLMHWASWPQSFYRDSSCLWLRATDIASARQSLVVPAFMGANSTVLSCARYEAQNAITVFLSI